MNEWYLHTSVETYHHLIKNIGYYVSQTAFYCSFQPCTVSSCKNRATLFVSPCVLTKRQVRISTDQPKWAKSQKVPTRVFYFSTSLVLCEKVSEISNIESADSLPDTYSKQ